jgi:hypothetical protein
MREVVRVRTSLSACVVEGGPGDRKAGRRLSASYTDVIRHVFTPCFF